MKLLYFAILRERLKKDQEEIEFKGNISQLRQLLIEKYPELEPVLKVVRFAVNEEYVGDEYELKGDERVALIPPVSGG
ncbi:MAG: molybdopterin converting factor subunit 1 [Aquificota bacterium]|jgi:molybdopterin synthase sulfur carrier subunit|nr:molybdopterin converting factor subunit 1 [Aquificaceae bacterium]MDM7266632.1 molybdopterin converting factor subunit 1 [Aquificaceae bacterium]QWK12386.1 MAG: molybdopterin converting factor subunit 1 [Aquificota bacterium]HCO39343.1 molybdopterin converting factor subunit 1 [Aquificaceae bacterium]